jgi:hypothetical protein
VPAISTNTMPVIGVVPVIASGRRLTLAVLMKIFF